MTKAQRTKVSEALEILRAVRDDDNSPGDEAVEVLAHVIHELEKLAD